MPNHQNQLLWLVRQVICYHHEVLLLASYATSVVVVDDGGGVRSRLLWSLSFVLYPAWTEYAFIVVMLHHGHRDVPISIIIQFAQKAEPGLIFDDLVVR